MIENKSLEVIPNDVWTAVVENTNEDKEIHWKGKENLFFLLSYFRFFFSRRYESNRTC